MGLDSLWVQSKPPGKLHKALPFEPPLCVVTAGIAVPEWAAAFRGQLYAEVVEAITGVSLFQDWIDNATVRRMAEALHAYVAAPFPIAQTPTTYLDIDLGAGTAKEVTIHETVCREEIADLARMFTAYGARGYNLLAYW